MILDNEEDQWLKELVLNHQNRSIPLAKAPSHWEIFLEEQGFIKWRFALDDHCLFFNGAYKGNPGKVGGGGVILSPGGSTKLHFAWGLGHETNNRVEALALWHGLNLAIKRNLLSISVFGDSRLIIQAMNSQKIPSQV